jgi:hypothetical protein
VYYGVKEGGIKPGLALKNADPSNHLKPIDADNVRHNAMKLRGDFVRANTFLVRDSSSRVRTPYVADTAPTQQYLGGPQLPILLADKLGAPEPKIPEIFAPMCATDVMTRPKSDLDHACAKFKDFYLEQQREALAVEEKIEVHQVADPNFVAQLNKDQKEHVSVKKTGWLTFLLNCHIDEFDGDFMQHQMCKMCTKGFNFGSRDPTVIRGYRIQIRRVKKGLKDFERTCQVEVEILHAYESEVNEFGKRPPTAMQLTDYIQHVILQGKADTPAPPNDCGTVAVGWRVLVLLRVDKKEIFNKPTSLLIKERMAGRKKKK